AKAAAESAEPESAAPATPAGAATNEPVVADEDDDAEVYITNERVFEFSRLKRIEESYKFIGEHPFILKGKYSDEILAEAFSLQMKGNTSLAKNCVHQSLIIQYCEVLGRDGVSLFFQRLSNPTHKAREQFRKDVNETYTRIANRVKELKRQEEEKELEEKRAGEARVAAALQPDGSYKLPVEDEEDQRRSDVFDTLPRALQVALLKQDVDEINGFLASAPKEEAEKYLKDAASVGLISLSDEVEEEFNSA
ncbi:hsp90 co-chaperone Cdc37, partial [Cladochytrium tenue]